MDTSGSMAGAKLEEAKNGSFAALDSMGSADSRISLIEYDGCNPVLVSNSTSDRESLKQSIRGFTAYGGTPIAKSLELAYSYLQNNSAGNKAFVLLFSDGEETCSGDPCEVVKQQKASGSIPIYTIGYMVDAGAERQLTCIANESGGEYFSAPTVDTVKDVFTEVAATIGAGCNSDLDCKGNRVCVNTTCIQSKLHFVYVPVNWMAGLSEFDVEVESQHNFLLSSLPSIADCTSSIKKTIINESLTMVDINQLDETEVFNRIENYTKNKYGYSYDYIVAIGAGASFSGNVVGYTLSNRNIVFVKKEYTMVTAHEMGHKFGLVDEYCSCPGSGHCNEEPNPLKSDLGCDVNGDCCWEDFKLFGFTLLDSCSEPYGCAKCCNGNKNRFGGRSIMSSADAEGPRYHDNVSLEHLDKNIQLRCN